MWIGEPAWYLAMVKVGFTSILSTDCADEKRESAHAKRSNAEFRARLHMVSRIGKSTNSAYHWRAERPTLDKVEIKNLTGVTQTLAWAANSTMKFNKRNSCDTSHRGSKCPNGIPIQER